MLRERELMTYKTLEGVLYPDGQVRLPREDWPQRPVRVLVTLLVEGADEALAEPGDYLEQLTLALISPMKPSSPSFSPNAVRAMNCDLLRTAA